MAGRATDAGASGEILRRSAGLLGQILADAKRRKYVDVNAARDLDRVSHKVRRGRAAEVEQVEAMRSHFLAAEHVDYAALLAVLAYVGLRPEEARLLRWDNLDGRRFVLDVEQTKSRTPERESEIPAPALTDLKRWRIKSGRPEGLIFARADGEPWTKSDWDNFRNRKFKPAAGAAGLLERDPDSKGWEGNFRPYDLRHTCASLVIRSGAPITEIAAHMGHSPQTLLRVYAHDLRRQRGKSPEAIADAIEAARDGEPRSVDVRSEGAVTFPTCSARPVKRSPERDSNS